MRALQLTKNAFVDINDLRERVTAILNSAGAALLPRRSDETLRARVAQLGQIAAGLAVVDPECLPKHGAGFGSRVTVKNLDSGTTEEYMLMVGSLIDVNANQVSLASPIGQALLGCVPGDEVSFETPTRKVRLKVVDVVTLPHILESVESMEGCEPQPAA